MGHRRWPHVKDIQVLFKTEEDELRMKQNTNEGGKKRRRESQKEGAGIKLKLGAPQLTSSLKLKRYGKEGERKN